MSMKPPRHAEQIKVAILLMLLAPLPALAQIGPNSKIPAVFLAPQSPPLIPGSLQWFDMHIENAQGTGPLVGATIDVVFPPEACDLLVLCGFNYTDCPRTYTQTTDSQGNARFFIRGGGCWGQGYSQGLAWDGEPLPDSYLVKIYVNSNLVALRGVRSADAVYATLTDTAAQLWCESPPGRAGEAAVGLPDALFHTGPIKSGAFSPCTDVDGDHDCDLDDAIKITRPIKTGTQCDEN